MRSSGIWAISIPATRTSNPRYDNSFNICATVDLSISFRVVVIDCDPRRFAMAWFLNFYRCARCKQIWTDQWSCTCDDDCPHCGARHMSPFDSENLTELVEQDDKEFVAIRSPRSAEHDPGYR